MLKDVTVDGWEEVFEELDTTVGALIRFPMLRTES